MGSSMDRKIITGLRRNLKMLIGDDVILQCPNCREGYLHHDKVEVYFRKEEDSEDGVNVYVDRNGILRRKGMRWNPSSRRDGVRICFYCEICDKITTLVIYQHKGNTFMVQGVIGTSRVGITEQEKTNKEKYLEYLRSDKWKKIAAKKRKGSKNKCQLCGNGKSILHVHHVNYDHVYKERLSDLIVLCEKCHKKFHSKEAKDE
jgi:5-methylcytosine-specific restriction endonuclease McrA